MIVIELIMGVFLLTLMKKNLNYYYTNKKKIVVFLTTLSISFFALRSILILVPWNYSNIEPSLIQLKQTEDNYPESQLVWAFVINFVFNIPMYIYVYFNIEGINFKIYLSVIMQGHNIFSQYEGCSVFIKTRSVKLSGQEYSESSDCTDNSRK